MPRREDLARMDLASRRAVEAVDTAEPSFTAEAHRLLAKIIEAGIDIALATASYATDGSDEARSYPAPSLDQAA
ncbi:MAG TPA: hypothetical protein VLE99_02810 [Candidatus Saccharimonadales bacterium]|nr:hypothetical protein [Candidatus Saccharimonadales bacterium]